MGTANRAESRVWVSHGFATLADLATRADLRERLMALERQATPGLDRRGQGAYLVNNLAFRLGAVLAAADLSGFDASGLMPGAVGVRARIAEEDGDGEIVAYVSYEVAAPPLPDGCPDGEVLGRTVEHLFGPMVEAVAAEARLGRGALWRLVADGVAGSYLNLGRELGQIGTAMNRARSLLSGRAGPLRNRQLGFLRIEVPATESPSGAPLCDWFRLRGGCCRFYTTEGGEYCGTCVLRQDRPDWLRQHMIDDATLSNLVVPE